MSGWEEFPRILLDLAVAFALGIPVGWDRERQKFGPGLRTYPLLAMGACGYLEIGHVAFRDHIDGQARVFQALVSGIGFIGAGAIVKGRAEVRGLATAVSLWVTVSVGIAASYQLFALAAVLSGTTLVALRLLKPLKRHPEDSGRGSRLRPIRLTCWRRSFRVTDRRRDRAAQTGGTGPRRNANG